MKELKNDAQRITKTSGSQDPSNSKGRTNHHRRITTTGHYGERATGNQRLFKGLRRSAKHRPVTPSTRYPIDPIDPLPHRPVAPG